MEVVGCGGSREPQSNVGAKEISQTFIGSGSSVKFDFPQQATPVLYLSFDFTEDNRQDNNYCRDAERKIDFGFRTAFWMKFTSP